MVELMASKAQTPQWFISHWRLGHLRRWGSQKGCGESTSGGEKNVVQYGINMTPILKNMVLIMV